jgi:hypothetical protein
MRRNSFWMIASEAIKFLAWALRCAILGAAPLARVFCQVYAMRSLALLPLLCLTACGPAPDALQPGDVLLPWSVAPAGCEAADIDLVQLDLTGAQGRFEAEAPCTAAQLTLSEVPAGRYTLTMRGLSRGAVVHDAPRALLVVHHDQPTLAPHTLLTARPATLALQWEVAACPAGPATLHLGLYGPSNAALSTQQVDCALGAARLTNLPAGTWTLGATLLPDGAQYALPVALKRGQRASLRLDL